MDKTLKEYIKNILSNLNIEDIEECVIYNNRYQENRVTLSFIIRGEQEEQFTKEETF